ncbi:MAG: NAD(P)-dependent alcohol dehydrogenase [Novosphingobium sp.]
MQVKAAVLSGREQPFVLKDVELAEPNADEILVRIVAVGLCHSDVAVSEGGLSFPLPGVLGHEGAGIVERVGSDVRAVAPGDHVVLSFDSCGSCGNCQSGTPSYCDEFAVRNFGGKRPDGTATLSDQQGEIAGNFFGQSSFAAFALARERNVVRIDRDLPLEIMGPLGCGIQTGAGAVLKALECRPGSSILIAGGGAVGLAGVMAAAIQGCSTIIVVEPVESRRSLAKQMGATHCFSPAEANEAAIRGVVPQGVDYVLDSSARSAMLGLAVHVLAKRGVIAMVGVPFSPDERWPLDFLRIVRLGATIRGIVEGDANPQSFIPELLDYYRAGRFPFDLMIEQYPIESINQAIEDQRRGLATKIVLKL